MSDWPSPMQNVKALEAKIGIAPPPPKARGTAKWKGWVEMEALKVQRSSWRKERKVEGVQNQNIDLCKVGGGRRPSRKGLDLCNRWNKKRKPSQKYWKPRKNWCTRDERGNEVQHMGKGVKNVMAATP